MYVEIKHSLIEKNERNEVWWACRKEAVVYVEERITETKEALAFCRKKP